VTSSRNQRAQQVLAALRGSLIVSVQAAPGEPLCAPDHILAMALSVINGGARGLRLESEEHIAHVRKRTGVPIVGLIKAAGIREEDRLRTVYITPTFYECTAIARAGADVVAVDATARRRPDDSSVEQIIKRVHRELDKLVWADVSNFEEGMAASRAGADIISTTLSGYTEETIVSPDTPPDFPLLSKLVESTKLPVVLEGRVWQPDDVREGYRRGAFAVVVGSAITRPQLITNRFVKALPQG
jgi:N-acylglucosamine-6-phosphate 2-epimerase